MKLSRTFATAILSGALAFGSGLSVAAAHHGDVSEHSTTKGKSLSAIEMQERQITAELNRKQLMPQFAALETPAVQTQLPAQPPMTEEQLMSQEDDAEATN
jgi:hypothetical protein